MESKIVATKITAIIRDDAPMLLCGDSPTYRRVTFDLTYEQRTALQVFVTGISMGQPIFESLSRIFWEK